MSYHATRPAASRPPSPLKLFLTTTVAAALVTVLGTAIPARAQLPAGGMSAAELNDEFRQYGDTSGQWSGADSTASVALPDGRLVWLFSDTFIGQVNADGTRPTSTPMVHNSMVVQDGADLIQTRVGGSAALPASLVGGDRDMEADNAGYWVGDGIVEGSTLRVLYNHYRKTGSGGLDVALTGTWLATFDLPGLTLTSLTDRQLGDTVAWGSAVVEDAGITYIYGAEFAADGLKFAHLARSAGGLAGTWEYWTGSGWSSQRSDSARIISGVGTAFGVHKMGGQYVLVTVEGNLGFNPTVVAYTATAPTGPFDGPITLYSAPEPQPGRAIITYDAHVHDALARSGKLLFSYNVNSLDRDDNYADARLYRPRFVEVDWPRPVPDPATLPPVPTQLTAATDDDGVVNLSWQGSAGTYWVYQRDVTAGQTHPARIPTAVTTSATQLSNLRSDHTYEFSVTAANSGGESARSTHITVTPDIPAPAAPMGVTATSDTGGKVTVAWTAVPRAWSYQVFVKDKTTGETAFNGMAKVGADATSQDLRSLANNHVYDVYVVADNGGGTSAPSTTVEVTTRFDPPQTPAGLTATPNSDGTITVRWNASGEGLWYQVYTRDITAGETTLSKLPLPVTYGTELRAGLLTHDHSYEFAVSALNGGGESPLSATVQAVASFPLPSAPTGLQATAGDGQVQLSWNATGPDDWYWIYQRDVTAGDTDFIRLPLPVAQGTTMTAGYLTNGHTYEFRVSATGQGGAEGPQSASVQATPSAPLPGTPTGLAATANSDGSITLTWSTPSTNVYHWIYQRDATAGEAWQKLAYPVTEGTTFTAGLLTHQHIYEFKVAATNSTGDSPTSNVASATSTYAPPPAPTGLRGNTDGDGSITLNWTASGPSLYYWVYYRDVTAGQSFQKSVYPTDKLTATMGGLQHGHVYEFKVTAENPGGEGPASTTVQVTALGGLPVAPTGLSASAGDGQVTLTWTASTTPNVYYWVEYRPVGGTWLRLEYPVSTCCTSTVSYLSNGTTYEFRVRATNISGDSPASNVASARPMPPLPQAPTGLSASAGDGRVTLTWTASTTSNVYYWIEFRPVGGTWRRLEYPVSTCCTQVVSYLTNGTTYEFRVRATNLSGDSPASNVASARPMPPFPQAPSGLTVTPAMGKATLRWDPSPTPNVWYWIEFRPAGGSWQRAAYPVTKCCTFTADYLSAPSYDFRVRATNLSGDSAASNTVSVSIPLPPAPTGFTASQAGSYQARLTWNEVAGADGYIIYHDVTYGMLDFPDLKPLAYPVMGGATTSFTVDYLTEFGVHWFAVAAIKYGRVGPKSAMDDMAPLMENHDYFYARARYFGSGVLDKDKKLVTNTRSASVDGGIVVARAYIASTGIYTPISDGRTAPSTAPNASARIHVAWDTGRGQLGALAQKSCVYILCSTALPIVNEYSGADDLTEVDYNYVWTDAGVGDNLTFHWKATNSDTNGIWYLGWHIDTAVHVWRTSGTSFDASLTTDHFPSYEVIQYPHWTTLGLPEARTLATCGQDNITGLTDAPGERRTCT